MVHQEEADYGPESQFAQTADYLNRLLDQHGRTCVEGEIGSDTFERRMRIDPNGSDYRLNDISIMQGNDGTYQVRHVYNTYTFDPRDKTVSRQYWMWPLSRYSPVVEPQISTVDDTEQRSLIVTISDALHNGKVAPDE